MKSMTYERPAVRAPLYTPYGAGNGAGERRWKPRITGPVEHRSSEGRSLLHSSHR